MSADSQAWTAYRAAVEQLPVIVVAFDGSGVLTVREGGGLALLGSQGGESVRRSVFDLYADRPDICSAVRTVLDGEAVHTELLVSGEVLDTTYLPVLEDGKVVGGVGFAAVVTEQRKSAHALERRSRFSATIAEMAQRAVEAGEDVAAVWSVITRAATELLGRVAVMHVIDDTGEWAQAVACHHRDPDQQRLLDEYLVPYRVRTTEGGISTLLRTGAPVVWKVDTREILRILDASAWNVLRDGSPTWLLLVPLRARGRVIGHLSIGRDEEWTEEERDAAVELADRAGLVVDNAAMLAALRHELVERQRMEDTLRHSLRQQSLVAELSTAALAGASVQEIARQGAEAIADALELDACQVVEVGRSEGDLTVIATAGDVSQEKELHRVVRDTTQVTRPTVVMGSGITPPLQRVGTAVSAPLQVRAARVGMIAAASAPPRVVKSHEILFIETVGNVVSAAMQQQQAAQAELRAAETERLATIGRVAAGMVHDYDNILMAVRLYTDLLREQRLDEQGRRHLSAIVSQVDLASDIAARVLDYARDDDVRMERFSIGAFVVEAVSAVTDVMPPDVDLDVQVVREARVHADPVRMRQVLLNLLDNAADAMPTGGRLRIRVSDCDSLGNAAPHALAGAHRWVCVEVVDTGIGMTNETLQRATEPFFTTKLPGKGTGLGLAQVHTIVTKVGGHLDIQSVAGQGTAVRIWLPDADVPPVIDLDASQP